MEISITGRHTSVTDPMKRHAIDKLSRLDRHNDMLTRADVVMSVEGDRQMIEMIAYCRKGGPFIGKAEHSDMYAAVDLLVDKMERQVKKHKDKIKRPSGRQSVRTEEPSEAAEVDAGVASED